MTETCVSYSGEVEDLQHFCSAVLCATKGGEPGAVKQFQGGGARLAMMLGAGWKPTSRAALKDVD